MGEIQIVSETEVSIDGVRLMTGDALRDQPGHANGVIKAYLRWLQERHAECVADAAAAGESRLAVIVAEHQAELARSQGGLAEVTAACDGLRVDVAASRSEVAAQQQRLSDLVTEANRLVGIARDETAAVRTQLAAAQAAVQHQATRADLATSLGMHVAAGDTPAAVAAMRALRRIEATGRLAQVSAELAAIDGDTA